MCDGHFVSDDNVNVNGVDVDVDVYSDVDSVADMMLDACSDTLALLRQMLSMDMDMDG